MEIQRLELQKKQMEQAKLEAEREYQLKQQQLAMQQSQFEKEYSLKQQQYSSSSGGSATISKTSSSNGSSIKGTPYAVDTEYYQGAKNKDAEKYGTFSNGYQPKGISGHGKLTKTGDTISISTVTLSGQKKVVEQTVWKTPDGKKWYWEGRENKYKEIPSQANNDATNVLMKYWDYNSKQLGLKR